jgi:PiT family inorganic phosphate transporter
MLSAGWTPYQRSPKKGGSLVKTMGQKITKLKPVGGFCAETGGAMTLFLAIAQGIPVFTTHNMLASLFVAALADRISLQLF